MPANLEKSAVATGLEKVSFHSNPKERQYQRRLKLPHNCIHLSSVQFNAQSCPTLCDPMNCSTPGHPVHHQIPEFTQTHYVSTFGKLSSGHRTRKGQFSLQSRRKAISKNAQTTTQLHSFHMLARSCLKSFKLGFNNI